jgi:hypothetical protein
MFCFILYDKSTDTFFICRDHIGKTPLYIGWGNDGSVYVGSEMKSLVGECTRFQNFPPGHCYTNKGENAGQFVRWYKPNWAPEMKPGLPPPGNKFQAVSLVLGLIEAVLLAKYMPLWFMLRSYAQIKFSHLRQSKFRMSSAILSKKL